MCWLILSDNLTDPDKYTYQDKLLKGGMNCTIFILLLYSFGAAPKSSKSSKDTMRNESNGARRDVPVYDKEWSSLDSKRDGFIREVTNNLTTTN